MHVKMSTPLVPKRIGFVESCQNLGIFMNDNGFEKRFFLLGAMGMKDISFATGKNPFVKDVIPR